MSRPRGRAAYNPISSSDVEEEKDEEGVNTASPPPQDVGQPSQQQHPQQQRGDEPQSLPSRLLQSTQLPTLSSRNYSLINADDVDDSPVKSDHSNLQEDGSSEDEVFSDVALDKATRDTATTNRGLNNTHNDDEDDDDDDDDDSKNKGDRITVVILDSVQKRFPIDANPNWTIQKFKRIGQTIHKVAPISQRLIFRGKLLNDDSTLKESGIVHSNMIVHLFPKPRVVVTNSSSSNSSSDPSNATTATDEDGQSGGAGAHIPQIILDAEEAERRGQILVLGSPEILEAQNNVKLLSLLWLVVCAMRLLALFSIAMGVSSDPSEYSDEYDPPTTNNHNNNNYNYTDGYGPAPTGGDMQYQTRPWQTEDYYDLAVHAVGFYVAALGMKATTENTLLLANRYLIGTIFIGIGWNIWNIFGFKMFVDEENASFHNHHHNMTNETNPYDYDDDDIEVELTRDDYVTVAFVTVILPAMVWGLCCLRAWQFRQLLEEAEEEAAERVQAQQIQQQQQNAEEDIETATSERRTRRQRSSPRMIV